MKTGIVKFLSCLVLLLAAGSATLQGQEVHEENFEIKLSDPGSIGTLEVEVHDGEVYVESHNGQNVLIHMKAIASVDDKEKDKDKEQKAGREGLRRIPSSALDVEIEEEDNYVEIDGGHKNRVDLAIKVPKNFNLEIGTHHNGKVTIKGVHGAIEVDGHHGDIFLENVGGSVVANTHHGQIKANFTTTDPEKPMAFSTYHGDVDITFPSSINANAKVKTTKGDIYTDYEVEMKMQAVSDEVSEDGHRQIQIGGGWMYGALGGGGQEYLFSSYHGDVIIRKS